MSGSPNVSFEDCATIQRQVRVGADARDGISVDRAYDIAERTMERMYQEAHPSPAPPKPKEEKVTPRVPCTTHREKSFKFSDATIIQCCSHDECGWGRTRKTHTDGMTGGTLYAIDIPDAVEADEDVESDEVSPEGTQELSIEGWASARSVETEDGIVPELPEEFEELVEDSASDEDKEFESCEA